MNRLLFFIGLIMLLPSQGSMAQPKVVNWYFNSTMINKHEAILTFTAVMEDGWHIYSQFLEEGGPMPTTFTINTSNNFKLVGPIQEKSTPIKNMDKTFDMPVTWFETTAVFTQRVEFEKATVVNGQVEFMACREELCLMPQQVKFSIEVSPK